jgi:hypothetical protein
LVCRCFLAFARRSLLPQNLKQEDRARRELKHGTVNTYCRSF